MNKYKIEIKLRGGAGTLWVPPNPEIIEAVSLKDLFQILSNNSTFPNNDLVETIGIKVEKIE